ELESRAATLDGELTTRTRERDSLQDDLKAAREGIEASHQRVAELESRTATLDGELASTNTERDSLRNDLKASREDAESSRQLIQARDASEGALLKEREHHNRRIHLLETDLAQARGDAERYREVLQSMEGRRQIFTTMLDEQETEILHRGNSVVKLETEVADRTRIGATRESDLKGLLAAEQDRVRQ